MTDSPSARKAQKVELLLSAEKIQTRIRELAEKINADYAGQTVHLIGVLKGSWIFLADLIRYLKVDVTLDFLGIASYGNAQESSGVVKITKDLDTTIEGLDVLVVEDILDTGQTFEFLKGVLSAHRPKSIKMVTLLDKASRRIRPVQADYVGFTIPDVFVVGYGLDFAQRYRELPDLCTLHLSPEELDEVRAKAPKAARG
jgi:hypoxanthine phosphoribosyltransferase